jgi:cytidine deaminase
MPDYKELIQKAIEAKSKAIATYSNFHVGAALLTEDGNIYQGANIENASYGLSMCAERTAIFSALIKGERKFTAIAIAGDSKDCLAPCGACRQIILEFCGKDTDVIMINKDGNTKTLKMTLLLPLSFDEESLKL